MCSSGDSVTLHTHICRALPQVILGRLSVGDSRICVSVEFVFVATRFQRTHLAPKVLAHLLTTKIQGPWPYSDRITIALFVVATRLHLLVGRELLRHILTTSCIARSSWQDRKDLWNFEVDDTPQVCRLPTTEAGRVVNMMASLAACSTHPRLVASWSR